MFGIFSSNYRTSVLNDFSSVRKAFFQIYKDKGAESSTASLITSKQQLNREFEFVEQFPVQINPNELKLDFYGDSKKRMADVPIDTEDCQGIPLYNEKDLRFDTGGVDIDLKYNVYDEYKARTVDGAIPGNEISLHSDGKTITSLEKLREYAGNRSGYYTMFIWGEIHIFGFMEKLNVTYESFSRWGEPLSATVQTTIARQPLGYNKEGIELDPLDCEKVLGKTGIAKAKSYTVDEDTAMRVQLLATNALR